MNTVAKIKANCARTGSHFFEPATMRFFNSRVLSRVYGWGFFVTSERRSGQPRLYTVRRAHENGSFETVGGFQAYSSRKRALTAAKRAAKLD